MELTTYFSDFLKNVRPTPSQQDNARTGHMALRDRVEADEDLSPIIVSTFLQGSYRRSTAVRPASGKRSDVDVVVVTTLDADEWTPQEAIGRFKPFADKHHPGKYTISGRAIQIELSYVDLDLVVTAAPSESEAALYKSAAVTASEGPEEVDDWRLNESWIALSERQDNAQVAWAMLRKAKAAPEWQLEPLLIPDRDAGAWDPTHPLEQIRWTFAKNARCNGYYVGVVKAIKWWRRAVQPAPKYPKGYPLEHIVGECCPDGIASMAEGVTRTLEEIGSRYAGEAAAGLVPLLPDRGVPAHNVLGRLSAPDFSKFHRQVRDAAAVARRAWEAEGVEASAHAWRELFGDRFPEPPGGSDQGKDGSGCKGGYTPRQAPTVIGGGRFA